MASMLSKKELANPAPPNRYGTTAPLVDINLITYNHERFIAKAIESVLEQKTDFVYRLTIGDDCSTDNTKAIIRDYAQQYPDRIQVLLASEHRGIERKDRVSIEVLRLNTSKYVALLDGDDYWTDPHKLQKQVDFLESHPECTMCFHNTMIFYEDGSQEPTTFCPPNQKVISTLEDLLSGNFIQSCSILFRRGLFGEFPDWFYTSKMGDWPIHIMNARHGNIGYIDEVMGAYRIHRGGLWSLQKRTHQIVESISVLDHINAYLDFKYEKEIRTTKAKWYQELVEEYCRQSDWLHAGLSVGKCLANSPNKKKQLAELLKKHTPFLYRHARILRNRRRSITFN